MGCQGTLLFADKKYNPIHIHGGNLESMCKPRINKRADQNNQNKAVHIGWNRRAGGIFLKINKPADQNKAV